MCEEVGRGGAKMKGNKDRRKEKRGGRKEGRKEGGRRRRSRRGRSWRGRGAAAQAHSTLARCLHFEPTALPSSHRRPSLGLCLALFGYRWHGCSEY